MTETLEGDLDSTKKLNNPSIKLDNLSATYIFVEDSGNGIVVDTSKILPRYGGLEFGLDKDGYISLNDIDLAKARGTICPTGTELFVKAQTAGIFIGNEARLTKDERFKEITPGCERSLEPGQLLKIGNHSYRITKQ